MVVGGEDGALALHARDGAPLALIGRRPGAARAVGLHPGGAHLAVAAAGRRGGAAVFCAGLLHRARAPPELLCLQASPYAWDAAADGPHTRNRSCPCLRQGGLPPGGMPLGPAMQGCLKCASENFQQGQLTDFSVQDPVSLRGDGLYAQSYSLFEQHAGTSTIGSACSAA